MTNKDCTKCLLRSDQVVDDEKIQLLTQYIPYNLIRFIGETDCCVFEKRVQKFEGVVIYFDIIGFTRIVVNYLETKRDIGDLSDTFSEFYSVVIETIREFAGSVYQFAGDSLLISYERFENESKTDNFKRAFTSMLRVLQLSDNYNSVSKDTNGFPLFPKIGIGYGSFNQLFLGSRDLFITPIIIGNAVTSAVQCEQACSKQEIICDSECFSLVKELGLQDYFTEKEGLYELKTIPDSIFDNLTYPDYFDISTLYSEPHFYNRLVAFINPVILQQVKSSYQGFSGEYKDITCIMVRFNGDFAAELYKGETENSFTLLNEIYTVMQNKATRYGGYCVKPDFSDKGVVFPVLFGSPSAIENKERNAVLCAAEILTAAQKHPDISSLSIGIGTGMVYSGEFGGIFRKDYTVIGNSVNFASRFMAYAAAKSAYAILLDENTKKMVNSFCEVNEVTGITCKGYTGLQTAYLLTSIRKSATSVEKKHVLIGRDKEMKQLNDLLKQSMSGHMNFAPIIGDAGMGKTYLVENFIMNATTNSPDVEVLSGSCFQYEETTSFFCWRSIIKKIINMPEDLSDDKAEKMVLEFFTKHFSEEVRWIPVFLNMLGFDFTESEETAEMNILLKQNHFFSIVDRILQNYSEKKSLIIVLEDMQWCDSVSLGMLEYFISSIGSMNILLISVSRENKQISDFFTQMNIPIIHLDQLTDDASSSLAETLLNMDEEEPLLVRKIVATSDGNPFFIENIVHSLVESGTLIEETNGKRHLSQNIKSIQNIIIPTSIQNIILSRLNTLKFEEQIVCKTASAIGKTFYVDCLREVLPEGISEKTLDDSIKDFEIHNIIVKSEKNDSEYCFKHIIIHDIIYDTILDATKKELNLMVLSYLEKKYQNNTSSVAELLEYHAQEAKEYAKLFQYAGEAAKKTERQFSAKDTISHCLTALSAWNKIEGEKDKDAYFRVQLCLGDAYRVLKNIKNATEVFTSVITNCKTKEILAEAYKGLGRCAQEQGEFDNAVTYLEQGLRTNGKHIPKSQIAVYCGIVSEVFSQVWHYGILRSNVRQFKGRELHFEKTYVESLFILNKLYYFGYLEKLAWSSLSNFNIVLHMRNESEQFLEAVGDYAVSLCSVGFAKFGKNLFDKGLEASKNTTNMKAVSIFKSRYAYYYLFFNDPASSIRLLEDASLYFRKIDEQWELMTAEGALAQNYFLVGDFEKSIEGYLETRSLGEELHSAMHIGWSFNKVPFMKYLRNEYTAEEAEKEILHGVELSESTYDHMSLCIHYGHLAYIATHEKQFDNALNYADKIMHENKIYQLGVPHVKISFINAVEAVCEAFNNNAVPKGKESHYWKVAKTALNQITKLSKTHHMLDGPVARATAVYADAKHDTQKARAWYEKSVAALKDSPYKWEYETTLAFGKQKSFE